MTVKADGSYSYRSALKRESDDSDRVLLALFAISVQDILLRS
jgi:hypothetical protein